MATGDTVSSRVLQPFNIAKLNSDADCSTLVAAVLTTSVLVHTGIVSPYPVLFVPEKLLQLPPKIPELWRLITPFLITGPKFGILMDTYFLYTYCSGLETGSPRFSEAGSFFVYLMFIMGVILVSQCFPPGVQYQYNDLHTSNLPAQSAICLKRFTKEEEHPRIFCWPSFAKKAAQGSGQYGNTPLAIPCRKLRHMSMWW